MNIKYGKSKKSVKAAFRDNIVDTDAVRELVLTITNDGDQYRRQITPAIDNLKRKYKKGAYDRDLAVKLWQYVADEGVRRYNKEFGSGTASVAWLNPATRKAIAEELRDYYEDEIMYEDSVEASQTIDAAYDNRQILWVLDGTDNTWKCWGFAPNRFILDMDDPKHQDPDELLEDLNYRNDANYIDYIITYNGENPDDYGRTEPIKDKFVQASHRAVKASTIMGAADISNLTIYVPSDCYVDVMVDSYEQGEGEQVNSWTFQVADGFRTAQELIDDIAESSGIFSNDINDYVVLDSSLQTDATVNVDNMIPTDAEIEAWKRGELELYVAHLWVRLQVGSATHDMSDDEAEAFGLSVY